MKQETSLTSLAILSNMIDKGSDYLDFFVPLVEYILSINNCMITSHNISDLVEQEFGLLIPHETIELILTRLVKRKVLYRKDHQLYVESLPETVSVFNEKRLEIQRKINSLVKNLVEFAKEKFNMEVTIDDASIYLVSFLTDFSASFVNFALKKSDLPIKGTINSKGITLVSKFIQYTEEYDLLHFNYLIDLACGTMIANALIIPTNLSQIGNFKKVKFYFDTPLILNLLKLSGKINYESAKQLVFLIKELKGQICCFSHTIEESRSVISSSAESLNSPDGFGRIVEIARQNSCTKSELLRIGEKLHNTLQELGIRIEYTPPYTSHLQINETKLEEKLDFYRSQKTKEYDINSIRSIFVLRGDEYKSDIKDCVAIFVTNNSTLVEQTKKFCAEHNPSFSPLITSFTLKTIAWLHSTPNSQIPKLEVVAYSYAATLPSQGFLTQIGEQIEKMKDQEQISLSDYQILKTYRVKHDYYEYTLLEDKTISSDSVEEYLTNIRDQIREDEANRYKPITKELDTFKRERSFNNCIEKERKEKSQSISTKIVKRILFGTSIALIFVSMAQFINKNITNKNVVIGWLAVDVFIFLLGVMGLLSTTIPKLSEKLHPKITKFVYKYLVWKDISYD